MAKKFSRPEITYLELNRLTTHDFPRLNRNAVFSTGHDGMPMLQGKSRGRELKIRYALIRQLEAAFAVLEGMYETGDYEDPDDLKQIITAVRDISQALTGHDVQFIANDNDYDVADDAEEEWSPPPPKRCVSKQPKSKKEGPWMLRELFDGAQDNQPKKPRSRSRDDG